MKSKNLQNDVISEVVRTADRDVMEREGITGFWIGLRRVKFAFLGGITLLK